MSESSTFRFDTEDWMLLRSVANEVVHGFDVPEFEQTIGTERSGMANLLALSSETNQTSISVDDARFLRNALRETIRELGLEEFHTRTGYGLEQGQSLLRRLNQMLEE